MGIFHAQLKAFQEKVEGQASDLVGLVVVKMHERIDRRSPVGDATYWKSPPPKGYVGGHFRGGWRLSVGALPAGDINRIDPEGSAARAGVLADLPGDGQNAGKVYYLFNGAPYGDRIEHGWSRQSPQGVVGLTVIEFDAVVTESVAQVQR